MDTYTTIDQTNWSAVIYTWNGSLSGVQNVSADGASHSLVRNIMVIIILGVLDLGAIIGNILVVLSVVTNRRLRTVTNYFVVSLATADLLVSILVMPLGIVVEITGLWFFGIIMCESWIFCDVMLCTSSILNLCCISLDRYFAITNPLIYATRRNKRLALIMITVVWIAAAIITCPPMLGWREDGRWKDSYNCGLTKDPGYIIYSSLGSFYVPLFIMVFVYMRIFKVTWDREKRLKPYKRRVLNGRSKWRGRGFHTDMSSSEDNFRSDIDNEDREIETALSQDDCDSPNPRFTKSLTGKHYNQGYVNQTSFAMQKVSRGHCDMSGHHHQHSTKSTVATHNNGTSTHILKYTSGDMRSFHGNKYFAQNSSKKDQKRRERAALLKEHKAAKTLAVVVGGFILCWLPFFLVYVIDPFCDSCFIAPNLQSFITWLGYFNSFLNPFIYAFYSREFRYSFWKLTFGICMKTDRV